MRGHKCRSGGVAEVEIFHTLVNFRVLTAASPFPTVFHHFR